MAQPLHGIGLGFKGHAVFAQARVAAQVLLAQGVFLLQRAAEQLPQIAVLIHDHTLLTRSR